MLVSSILSGDAMGEIWGHIGAGDWSLWEIQKAPGLGKKCYQNYGICGPNVASLKGKTAKKKLVINGYCWENYKFNLKKHKKILKNTSRNKLCQMSQIIENWDHSKKKKAATTEQLIIKSKISVTKA